MKARTVLSLEQALSLPYATLRFAQLGWRVIRIESTAALEDAQPGDPNRYIGRVVADEGRRSYFIAQNVGKEAIALNLKRAEGQAVLRRLLTELDVDVFCCNILPSRYRTLGIDYDSLSAERPSLIWAGISAMGPEYPNVPGYDPMIQAMCGYMEVTGRSDGPPMLAGIPLIDLKAGDEVYANVMMALVERAETGRGKRIDVSLLQVAASWLITTLPLVDMGCGPEEITRWGTAHRKFIPTNLYRTADGFIYVAIGSSAQWERLTSIPEFRSVAADGSRAAPERRYEERTAIYTEIEAISSQVPTARLEQMLSGASIPHARVNTVLDVLTLAPLRDKFATTSLPNGQRVRLPPAAVDLGGAPGHYKFPARHGEHTERVLQEAGFTSSELRALRHDKIVN